MEVQTRLLLTKVLVVISIVGSLLSLYTMPKGWGEVYPFFTWKLYSQPLGTQEVCTEYRIYSRKNDTCSFKRNSIHATETFSTDEYVYTFNYLILETLEDSLSQNDYKNKLLLFAKHIVPNEKEYKVVSETYKASDLLIDIYKYDTATVITF